MRKSLCQFANLVLFVCLTGPGLAYQSEPLSEDSAGPDLYGFAEYAELFSAPAQSWLSVELTDDTDSPPVAAPDAEFEPPSPYEITLFNARLGEDKERLWSQTKLIFGLGVGVSVAIAALPRDVSGWKREDFLKYGPVIWWENVKGGPVWDQDAWYLNWVGHTYFGGVFYQVARKSGYRQWDSFIYSALLSTFYWEYGIEAFSEPPSIQDIVITPIFGWVYGEWAFNKEKAIVANDGKAMNSEFWGSVALFFLDPVDRIGVWINNIVGNPDFIKTGSASLSRQPAGTVPAGDKSDDDTPGGDAAVNDYWGLHLEYRF